MLIQNLLPKLTNTEKKGGIWSFDSKEEHKTKLEKHKNNCMKNTTKVKGFCSPTSSTAQTSKIHPFFHVTPWIKQTYPQNQNPVTKFKNQKNRNLNRNKQIKHSTTIIQKKNPNIDKRKTKNKYLSTNIATNIIGFLVTIMSSCLTHHPPHFLFFLVFFQSPKTKKKPCPFKSLYRFYY